MVLIVGAGGHALEVYDEVIRANPELSEKNLFCYDHDFSKVKFKNNFRVIHTQEELKEVISEPFKFCLGIGNPQIRKKMINSLERLGGSYLPLRSKTATISESSCGVFDAMNQCFIGPEVEIGLGSLINVGAKIHHEANLGAFVEVGPGAMILGSSKVGGFTQIGAGAVILPGVRVGENCKIGAGSVVTRNIEDGVTAYGVPCKVKVD